MKQWKPVYVITMVQSCTYNINRLITIGKLTQHVKWKPLNVITMDDISCSLISDFTGPGPITVNYYVKVT